MDDNSSSPLVLAFETTGHSSFISRVSWSSNGEFFAVSSYDHTLSIWELESYRLLWKLEGHMSPVLDVAWSEDSTMLASCSGDSTVRIWRNNGVLDCEIDGFYGYINCLTWIDNVNLYLGSSVGIIYCYNCKDSELLPLIDIKSGCINCIKISEDKKYLAIGSDRGRLSVFFIKDLEFFDFYDYFNQTVDSISSLNWSIDSKLLYVTTFNNLILVFDIENKNEWAVLEGHLDNIVSSSISSDNEILASKSDDGTVLLWNCKTLESIYSIEESANRGCRVGDVAFHPDLPVLATLGANNTSVRLWSINHKALLSQKSISNYVHYVNAKVVLVGESGVGKSSLGYRIAEGMYRAPESSTHGAQFWNVEVPSVPAGGENINAEITLWDLAGQPEYRLVHQLFLNDTDVALLLFDCSDAQEPFRGVPYWSKALRKHLTKSSIKFLVSSRCDVSPVSASDADINAVLSKYKLDCHFKTSSYTGDGVDELWQAIEKKIPWQSLKRTSTPELFEKIRKYIFSKKEDGKIFLEYDELYRELGIGEASGDRKAAVAVVSLLENRGLLFRLSIDRRALLLLKPELVNQYASSIIQAARNHPKSIGAIAERDVLVADFPMHGFKRLSAYEERLVLYSTVEMLLKHDLCFREVGLLVFPSQINLARPEKQGNHPPIEIVYEFSGSIETIFASLVVRLSHTDFFNRVDQWKNSAEFLCDDKKMGFKITQVEEGTGEIGIYFYPGVEETVKITFINFITDHLRTKGINIIEKIKLICQSCGNFIEDEKAVKARIELEKIEIPCQYCDNKVMIPKSLEEKFKSDMSYRVKQEELKKAANKKTKDDVRDIKEKFISYKEKSDSKVVNILHLSDLHFDEDTSWEHHFTALKTDLNYNLSVSSLGFLVLSGDVARHSVRSDYYEAFNFIDNLVKEFSLDPEKIIIIPGNHDLNWDITEESYTLISKRKMPKKLIDGKYIDAGDLGVLILDDNKWSEKFSVFNENFYKKIFKGEDYPTDFKEQYSIQFDSTNRMVFLGLNTSWEIDHHFKNRASVEITALSKALRKIQDKGCEDWLKVCVLHHSVNGKEMIEDDFMELLASNGFQLVLHGHVHESNNGFYNYDNKRNIKIVGAGTFGALQNERIANIPLQYNLISYEPEEGRLTINTRKKEKDNGSWCADARWGDKNKPLPHYEFSIN